MIYHKKMNFFWILLVFVLPIYDAADCGKEHKDCQLYYRTFRTFDGSYNNLNHTQYGIANSPYARLLPAKYADGKSTIANSVTGKPLPNARFLSEQVFVDVPNGEKKLTTLIIGALQFVAHDLSFGKTGSDTKCCTELFQTPKPVPSHCRNIKIPSNDPVYSEFKADCIPLANTQTNYDIGSPPVHKQSEQISSVSHWLDLSVIYGNSYTENKGLRTGTGGGPLLKTEERNGKQYLPDLTDKSQCEIPKNNKEVCYKTGDARANTNSHIAVHTTMWVRDHNNVARFFQKLNPCWDEMRVFLEAREVVTAEHQWITYNEIMPLIVGRKNMYDKKLLNEKEGYTNYYDNTCSPNVLNEMAQAAFRALHSFIKGHLVLADEREREAYDDIDLRDHMNRPQIIEKYDNFDSLVRGMTVQYPHHVGVFHDKEVTQNIFMKHSRVGSDLKAIDIHRARLHGLPSYNDMRSYCGLKKAKTFNDFTDAMHVDNAKKLQSVYAHPDDVDLTVGGQLEIPRGDALIGPTFLCIFLEQLHRTQKCDRFWFENESVGFSMEQLKEIKKQTMSTFVCDTSNKIEKMQPHAFEPISEKNKLQSCKTLPRWNLNKWKDPSCGK